MRAGQVLSFLIIFARSLSVSHSVLVVLQLGNIANHFPGALSHDNMSLTYQALVRDKLAPRGLIEIRAFLQQLMEDQGQIDAQPEQPS